MPTQSAYVRTRPVQTKGAGRRFASVLLAVAVLAVAYVVLLPWRGGDSGAGSRLDQWPSTEWGQRPDIQPMTVSDPVDLFETLPELAADSFDINPSGGVYTAPNTGVSLIVDEGTVLTSQSFSITERAGDSWTSPSGAPIGVYHLVAPDLEKPVTVVFPNRGQPLQPDHPDTYAGGAYRIGPDEPELYSWIDPPAEFPDGLAIRTQEFSYWGVEYPDNPRSANASFKWRDSSYAYHLPKKTPQIIELPYLNQGDTGSCWSTGMSMLIASYRPTIPWYRPWDINEFMGVRAQDGYSFYAWYWTGSPRRYLESVTQRSVEDNFFLPRARPGDFLDYVLGQLAESRPVYLVMPGHVMFVVGFKTVKDEPVLIVHDPANYAYTEIPYEKLLETYFPSVLHNLAVAYTYVVQDAPPAPRSVAINLAHNSDNRKGPVFIRERGEDTDYFNFSWEPQIPSTRFTGQPTTDDKMAINFEITNTWRDQKQNVVIHYVVRGGSNPAEPKVVAENSTGKHISLEGGETKTDYFFGKVNEGHDMQGWEPGEYELAIWAESPNEELLDILFVPFSVGQGINTTTTSLDLTTTIPAASPVVSLSGCRTVAHRIKWMEDPVTARCYTRDFSLDFEYVCEYTRDVALAEELGLPETERTWITRTYYPSWEAFVAEQQFGITTRESTWEGHGEVINTVYNYDAAGRLGSSFRTAPDMKIEEQYFEWDGLGRPTRGYASYLAYDEEGEFLSSCEDVSINIGYDDESLMIYTQYDGGQGSYVDGSANLCTIVQDLVVERRTEYNEVVERSASSFLRGTYEYHYDVVETFEFCTE